MSSIDIRRALEKHLSAISGIPSIAYENRAFTPTTGTEWVRSTVQFQNTRQDTLGTNGIEKYEGLYLIDLFYPEGGGPGDADTMADTIKAQFDPGDIFTENGKRIRVEYSERGQGRNESPWYFVPVSVRWYSYI